MAHPDSPRRVWHHPDYSAVTLGAGLLRTHHDINHRFLMARPLDGLLYPFQDAAGLQPDAPGERCFGVGYGEFCGAWIMAACDVCQTTGDRRLRAKLDAVLDGLVACARTTPGGHLPVSSRTYPAYYTRGVMLHALRSAAQLTGRQDVGSVLAASAEDVVSSLRAMGLDQARRVVRGEYPWWDEGNGLCEILSLLGRADALDMVTGRFLRDPLARNEDVLQYRHANAASMLIMGWPAAYELTGDRAYIHAFFNSWRMILARTYVTGGSCDEYGDGDWEAWPEANNVRFIAKTQETCTAFHWLRHNDVMLSYTGEAQYGDMIERVLYNRLLTSHQSNGAFRYWTDMRDYARFEDFTGRFTCCSNSGVRVMAMLPRYIYYLDDSGPIVSLYTDSTLRFTAGGAVVTLAQTTAYPGDGRVQIKISCPQRCQFNLRLRVPGWVSAPVTWHLNDRSLPAPAAPATYASLARTWNDGDVLSVEFPMTLHAERARNSTGHYSFLCGPAVLAAVGRRPFLQLVGDPARPDRWLKALESSPLHFEPTGQWTSFTFKPFYTVGDDEMYNLHFALSDSYPLGTRLRATDDGLCFSWPDA